jgi:RimJ/RimL family protein N-acetyltransferase
MTPRIETDRLILRAPEIADFEPYAAFYASERSTWEDGPLDRAAAWSEFASGAAGWVLRGYGPFSLVARATGRYLGEVGIYHPPHFPEPELGWILTAEAEGHGFAAEAARVVRGWAYDGAGLPGLVSYIARGNRRSIRLAERLGAVADPDAPSCSEDAGVWRHPGPEGRAESAAPVRHAAPEACA